MGIPVAAVTALTNTRIGRRIVIGTFALLALAGGFLLTPLFATPFAAAESTIAEAEDVESIRAASGGWGYPLAGAYFKGRGFGYNPVHGCRYCSTNHKGYDMSQGCGSAI